MRPAAGLAVDAIVVADADEPDAAGAGRRLDVLRSDQPRIGGKLLVGDPVGGDRMVRGDELHQPLGHLFLVDGAGVANVEVEPALLGADRARR